MAKKLRTPYEKLIKRLFDSMFVLRALGKTQGPHLLRRHDPNDPKAVRRRFLTNLACVCDVHTAGKSVTAVAVEELDDEYKFWVACNNSDQPDVVKFLNTVLAVLKRYPTGKKEYELPAQEALTRQCIEFCAKRIRDEARMLSNAADRCIKYIKEDTSILLGQNASEMISWLGRFVTRGKPFDGYEICRRSYNERRAVPMSTIQRLSKSPLDGSNPGQMALAFRQFRHVNGRLAKKIKIPQQLCEDVGHVTKLLDSYRVARIKPPQAAPRPVADDFEPFDKILNRMIQPHDNRKERLEERFLVENQRLEIEKKIREEYDDSKSRVYVHAEMQMLDYFWLGGERCRKFAMDDKFIACSKPACFCCKLYFRNHPAGFVEPDSHDNVYPAWSPIHFQPSKEEYEERKARNQHSEKKRSRDNYSEDYQERRNILIAVNRAICEKAFEKVLSPGSFPGTHRDSVTGTTESTNANAVNENDNSSDMAEYWDLDSSSDQEITPSESTESFVEVGNSQNDENDEIDDEGGGVTL